MGPPNVLTITCGGKPEPVHDRSTKALDLSDHEIRHAIADVLAIGVVGCLPEVFHVEVDEHHLLLHGTSA